jgi:hypothetical protein
MGEQHSPDAGTQRQQTEIVRWREPHGMHPFPSLR